MKLVIASNNKGKIREYKQILEPLGYEVFSQSEAGLILDVEETGTTFAEYTPGSPSRASISRPLSSASTAQPQSLNAALAFSAEFSARYGGLETDDERTALVLKKMKEIPDDKRGAHFTCTIHFIKADGEEIAVEGKVFGKIAHEPVGENGFGYDPIFMYGNKSFAQVDSETKNTVSHRANALKALLEQLTKQ